MIYKRRRQSQLANAVYDGKNKHNGRSNNKLKINTAGAACCGVYVIIIYTRRKRLNIIIVLFIGDGEVINKIFLKKKPKSRVQVCTYILYSIVLYGWRRSPATTTRILQDVRRVFCAYRETLTPSAAHHRCAGSSFVSPRSLVVPVARRWCIVCRHVRPR